MAATNGYDAKAALMTALAQRAAQPGNGLTGRQVLYAFNAARAEDVCVYGGGVVTDQPGDRDAYEGTARLAFEVATIGVHVRVRINPNPAGGIADSDAIVSTVLDEIAAVIAANPRMGGPNTAMRVAGFVGDYSPDDDAAVSTGSLRIEHESFVQ